MVVVVDMLVTSYKYKQISHWDLCKAWLGSSKLFIFCLLSREAIKNHISLTDLSLLELQSVFSDKITLIILSSSWPETLN